MDVAPEVPAADPDVPPMGDALSALVDTAEEAGLTVQYEFTADDLRSGPGWVVMLGGLHPQGGRFAYCATTYGERWARVVDGRKVNKRMGQRARRAMWAVIRTAERGYTRPPRPVVTPTLTVERGVQSAVTRHTNPVNGYHERHRIAQIDALIHGREAVPTGTMRVVGRGVCTGCPKHVEIQGGWQLRTVDPRVNTWLDQSADGYTLRCCTCNTAIERTNPHPYLEPGEVIDTETGEITGGDSG